MPVELLMLEEVRRMIAAHTKQFRHPPSDDMIIRWSIDVAREHYGRRLASRLLDPESEEEDT